LTGPRRTYDDAQRAAFLREASLPGSAIHVVARAHGISSGTAYRWLHEARDADPPPNAVAVLLCSDWHIGALVEAAEMRGMYAYDTEVCRSRIESLGREVRTLLRLYSDLYTIRRLYLLWAGDILDGTTAYRGQRYRLQLHTPEAQRHWAHNHICRFTEELASEVPETVGIVCAGNHARIGTSDDVPASEDSELRLFTDIARDTVGVPHLTWERHRLGVSFVAQPTGNVVYMEHGQRVPWGGKTSQPTPSTWTHAYQRCMDEGRIAEVVCWGHRHTPAYLHGRPHILSNGCMTGYNEYAREGALRPTLPSQWMFGLSDQGLAWTHNIVLGGWPETYADERTGVLRGTLSEAEAEA